MENASKALIIAGSMIIALIVISLLVFFFNNLKSLVGVQQGVTRTEQVAEYNKSYEAYARNVYGSELLSIANKINDYNVRQADEQGYTHIDLEVQINKNIDNEYFQRGSTLNANELINNFKEIENKVETLGKETIVSSKNSRVSRTISKLASMRTSDIEQLGFEKSQYDTKVSQYNTYKTLLSQVKATAFKYENIEYDKYNGRVTKMIYSY